MGTKVEIETVEGMRKAAHTAIDSFFNNLPVNPDGMPRDRLEMRSEQKLVRTDGGGLLSEGTFFGVMVEYRHPKLMLSPKDELVLKTREGKFRLANPNGDAINSLVRFCVDVLGGMDEAKILDTMLAKGVLYTDMPISDIARQVNLLFEPVVDPEPVEVEAAPAAETDDTAEQVAAAAVKEREEQEARERAEKAEAEAREAEERREREAEEKRKADDTQQLTPEALADLREESAQPESPAVEEPATPETTTEPEEASDEPAAETGAKKSNKKKNR